MKEKLFRQLQDQGKIPPETKLEDVTEEFLLRLVGETYQEGKKPTQLTEVEFEEFAQKALDKKLKDMGLDKIDVKYLKLPGWEDGLDDNEKKLLENPSTLTAEMRREIANKQLRALIAPVAAGRVPARQLALNAESSDAVGRYTVPEQFVAEVSRLLENYGVMRRNANPFTMASRTARKPKILTVPTGGYVTETSAKSESNPTFAQIDFTRHDYAFITGVTKQLLEDTGVDLIGLLAELAAFDFGRNEDAQCFINASSTLTGSLSGDSAIVAVTTSAANLASITNADLINMIFSTAFGESTNSKWYLHRTILAAFLTMKDLQDRPLYSLQDQLAILSTRSFLGYSYELVEVMQVGAGTNYLGAADPVAAADIIAYFGDMRRAATLATRKEMDIMVSQEATVGSNSAFEKNLLFWRFEMAHDFNVEQGKALTKLVLGGSQ